MRTSATGSGSLESRYFNPVVRELAVSHKWSICDNPDRPRLRVGGIEYELPGIAVADQIIVVRRRDELPRDEAGYPGRRLASLPIHPAPRILLPYGSLRERSFSRLGVEEAARL